MPTKGQPECGVTNAEIEQLLPLFRKLLAALRFKRSQSSPEGSAPAKGLRDTADADAWCLALAESLADAEHMPEYGAAIDALRSNSQLRERLDEIVGISGMGLSFWSPQVVLRGILQRLLPEQGTLRDVPDAKIAQVIEAEIGERSVTYGVVRYVAPVFGLKTDAAPLEFSEELAIVRMTDEEMTLASRGQLQAPMIAGGDFVSARDWYAIRLRLRRPILIGDIGKPKEEMEAAEAPYKTIQNVLLALRLLKAGDLVCPGVVATSPQSTFTQTRYFHDTGRIRDSDPYRLVAADLTLVKEVLEQLTRPTVVEDKALQIALRRFTYALDRERPDDRLLDLAIAGEALFQPYARGESALRLALAAAVLLEPSPPKRRRLYTFMQAAYRVRGAIAHGRSKQPAYTTLTGKEGLLEEMNADLENVLRKAIRVTLVATSSGKRKENWEQLLFGE
jgi:hypothetical protein